jgi:protein-S-isoprenylcysteine O-methyltransferase Ste14
LAKPGTWVQRWRVPLGFFCAALFFLLSRPRPLTLAVGGVVALPGLALRAWASGHLRKNDALAITGPYAYTRNPLYLGSFLMGVGFTIASGRLILGIIFAALFLGIYVPVMRVESATLAKLFGESYQKYMAAVPLFSPHLSPYRAGTKEKTGFDAALYKRYREYQAAIGLIIAWALLALKAFVLGSKSWGTWF